MRPSPLSLQLLPNTVATVAAFAPPVAAVWARRSLREPAGQVAACWMVMALLGCVGFLRFYGLFPWRTFPAHVLVTGGFPLLLLPPTLTWCGAAAKRWQPVALAGWLVCVVALVAMLGTTREFAALGDPVMASVMCVATGLALGAQSRDATGRIRRHDWSWILVAHLVYFATDLFRMPLQEALVARHWDAGVAVNAGFMFVYVGVYALLSRGMLLPARATAAPAAQRPALVQTA